MSKELAGKTAVVTGARRGIGRASALALAGAGADLVISDIVTVDGLLEQTAGEIRKMGRRCVTAGTDISRESDVDALAKLAVKEYGSIDILANIAGVWLPGQNLIDTPEENWDKVIDINLKGTWYCCKVFAKLMGKKGDRRNGGSIINMSSQVGLNPGAGGGAYSISKAGIIMMTRQLAIELADKHIRVNAIAPGIVRTDFNRKIWKDAANAQKLGGMVPLGRLAEPEDIAQAVLFLASDASSYITGTVMPVDGGWKV
jgi:NAD(P)-dependent dehydrogenase (short-subunit alcohol dehydrogenase family)